MQAAGAGSSRDAYLLFLICTEKENATLRFFYNLALCHVAAGNGACSAAVGRAMAQLRLNTAGAPSKTLPTSLGQAAGGRSDYLFRCRNPLHFSLGIHPGMCFAPDGGRLCRLLPLGADFDYSQSSFLIRTISMSSAPESLWKSKTKPRRRKTLMPFCNIKATALFAFCSKSRADAPDPVTTVISLSRVPDRCPEREIAQMPARATSV